jgi:uncharacterized protein (TIGR02611 family)
MIKHCKRPIVIGIGSCIAVLGLILMPVPGPGGTPVFLAGLAILATEVEWARRFLARFKEAYQGMSKRKRLTLTYSMLAFYLLSGVVAWNWANRPQQEIMEDARG